MKTLTVTVTLLFLIVSFALVLSNPVFLSAMSGKRPVVTHQVTPHYTDQAIKANVRGTVRLGISIQSDGTVGRVWIIRALGYGLDEKAIEAVKQWTFRPTGHQTTNTVDISFSKLDVK